ncbi:hypothetical protein [Ferruginibacter profundus]
MATNEKNKFNRLVMEENTNIPEDVNGESSDVNGETFQPIAGAIAQQSEIQNQQSEIDNMEVHHHTHPGHGKKTWKEYFWEFFMLFLAVFCGFLAEYQLEQTIEHHREKQYIESMVADLKSDQDVLSQNITWVKNGIAMMDTLTTILNTPSQIADRTGELYFLVRLAPRLKPLVNNSRTFEQLKNSGNFRLIRQLEASNKIMTYYEKFPLVRLLESINETEFTEYKKAVAKIFDPIVLVSMEGNRDEILRIKDNPPLRTMDKEMLQQLAVFAVYMRGTKKGVLGADEELKTAGAELIAYLQKEYHLE